MLANLDRFMKAAKAAQQARQAGQSGLFDSLPTALPAPITVDELPDWTLAEKLWFERKATGTYFSGHPTDLVREEFAHKITRKIREFDELMEFGSTEPIIVLGLVVKTFVKPAFAVIEIEDETGRGEMFVGRETFEQYAYMLWKDTFGLFKLAVRRSERGTSMDLRMAYRAGKFTEPGPLPGSKRG
jgi:DNA polymerase III alpha subunit